MPIRPEALPPSLGKGGRNGSRNPSTGRRITLGSIDDFLNSQRLGEFDSSGAFTVDWSRARQAYRDLGRADPTAFLLKILQTGFSCRPPAVHIKADSRYLEITWEGGREFRDTDLQLLVSHILTGQAFTGPRCTRHLGRALLLLAGRDDLEISLETAAGGFSLSPRGILSRSTRRPGTRIRIQAVAGVPRLVTPQPIDLSSILDMDLFSPLLNQAWPELNLIREKLGCQPLPLLLNGRPMADNGRLRPETLVTTRVYLADDPARCGLGFHLRQEANDCKYLLPNELECRQVPGHYVQGGILASNSYFNLGYSESKGGRVYRDALQLVADGIPVYETSSWLDQIGIAMVMDASDLPVDATTLALVEGAQWSACLDAARTQVLRFLVELEKRPARQSFLERLISPNTLDREAPEALKRARPVLAAWRKKT